MLELKEGIVARIINDEFPENIDKRVYLRHRPGSDFLAKEDLNVVKGWVVYPIDDIVVSYVTKHGGSSIAKGMEETFVFHVLVLDKDMEALESDNTGVNYVFSPNPLRLCLEKGVGDNVTH